MKSMDLFNVFFNRFLALSTSRCEVNMWATYPIREITKILMVIITTADELKGHLNIHLPAAYFYSYYTSCIACRVSGYFQTLYPSVFSFSSEGLCPSRGAPAVGCGEVVRFHHLLVWGVWHHEEQLCGPFQSAGVSHLHLPTRGLYPDL